MKHSDVFKAAALRIEREQNRLSCVAIEEAQGFFYGRMPSPARAYYEALFKPSRASADPFWGHRMWGDEGSPRIVALCLAAAIAKAEGK